jgi:hypothetical protein
LRILVGNDARVVDKLVRALPALYPRAVVAFSRRVSGESKPRSKNTAGSQR